MIHTGALHKGRSMCSFLHCTCTEVTLCNGLPTGLHTVSKKGPSRPLQFSFYYAVEDGSSHFCPLCGVYMMFPYAVVLVPLKVSSSYILFGNFARNADWDPVTVPGELPAPALSNILAM